MGLNNMSPEKYERWKQHQIEHHLAAAIAMGTVIAIMHILGLIPY